MLYKVYNFPFNCMSLVSHPYVTRIYSYVLQMSLVCSHISSACLLGTCMSFVCHSYVLVCHSYVLVYRLHVTAIYLYIIRLSLVCTRMSGVCHTYVLVCHPYVISMRFCHEMSGTLIIGILFQ